MKHSAITIANWFINQYDPESGDVITHLKLQKLLYFSEAWFQALKNKELFSEKIEAWAHGPVVREVFTVFKDSGWNSLVATDATVSVDAETEEVLRQVLDAYGELSAKTLEHMTHQDKPWKDARGALPPEAWCSNIIEKNAIKEYFIKKYELAS